MSQLLGANAFPTAIYCLRAGVGFGEIDDTEIPRVNPRTYIRVGDMFQNAAAVRTRFNQTTGANISVQNYNAILWIIEQMYLPRHEHSGELRTRLLTNAWNHANAQGRVIAGSPSLTSIQNALSSDDIEVIQQIALWQFTNYDQRTNALSPIINPTITSSRAIANMMVSYNNVTGLPINNGAPPRSDAIEVLFYYLVEGARANNAAAVQPVVTPSVSFGNTAPEIEVVSP
ncbi:MAG: Cys-Gln thioester bond-forming surface protein, partial [Oscillospiraceae bacterium]|nr:Cys-Gln thioester bond-forming surface protein [Oscillospiraceae bacterium]